MNPNDIPREIRDMIGEGESSHTQLSLAQLGQVICQKRDEAVQARKTSGIEDTWLECEEAYLGIDDENRNEFVGSRWAKPTTMQGPLTSNDNTRRHNSSNAIRATVFVRMTSRFVDVASAKIGEITLPIDDKAFTFTATPVPDLVKQRDSNQQVVHPQLGPLTRQPKPGEMAAAVNGTLPAPTTAPGSQSSPHELPLTIGDLAEEKLEEANKAAKKAETRIYDWMVESHYPAEMRKVQFDSSRIGVGVLKGPFPELRFDRAVTKGPNGKKMLTIQERVAPAFKWIDPWNFYPDPACGENIHSGSHVFEVDYLSPRTVEDFKDNPAYMAGCVDQVLKMGPSKKIVWNNDKPELTKSKIEDGRYEVWYYYGVLSPTDIEACVQSGLDVNNNGLADIKDSVYAVVTMINDMPVRATINPLESGKFCYHAMPWRRRAGHWAGVGVAEQIRSPQRMVNAATRMMLMNAAKAAGSQIVMTGAITPMDGNWTIYPDKLWRLNPDATVKDVREAFITFQFPSAQKEMMGIIEYAFKLAEETSNIPLISQGQSGKTTPDTLGGQQLQDNNANQLLRSVGYMQDDMITEPVVLQSYEWLLLDPDVPDEEKGDFNINAHGSAAMVERYIQNQSMPMIQQMALNPAFGLDPKKVAKETIKSQRLDPREFSYTPEEQKKIDAQPKQPLPQIEAATINSKARIDAANIMAGVQAQRTKADTDRDTAYNNSLAERDRIAGETATETLKLKREELQQELQLAMLKYAHENKVSLDKVKADLAKTAMIENVRKELASAEIALAQSEGRHARTHEAIQNNNQLRVNSVQPDSLVRDEMSTNVTP